MVIPSNFTNFIYNIMTQVRSKCCGAGVITETSGNTSCIKCGKDCGIIITQTPVPTGDEELTNGR